MLWQKAKVQPPRIKPLPVGREAIPPNLWATPRHNSLRKHLHTMIKPALFSIRLKVRDYECDLQGIVNNANYQHYTEHARHEFLISRGVSFSQMHAEGYDPVVARITMHYKQPLRSGDEFICTVNLKRDGIKYIFLQDIYRASDERLVFTAEVTTVVLHQGKLHNCQMLNEIFQL